MRISLRQAFTTDLMVLLGAGDDEESVQRADDPAAPHSAQRETIRQAMLASLGDAGKETYPTVYRRIMFCADIDALWFARSELMAALCDLMGEGAAKARLVNLSQKFEGLTALYQPSRTSGPPSERRRSSRRTAL